MTVGAKGNQILVGMLLALLPWNDMMHVDVGVSTGMNGTAVPRLDKDAAA